MSDLCPIAISRDSGNLVDQPKTAGESHLLLLKQKKYCDVTFKFPNLPNRIAAHEIHLKARSPVFEQIFRMRKSGNVQGDEIEIIESTPETFHQFLEFIYADKFEADIAGALGLLQLAQKYKIQPLIDKCEELLRTEIKVEESVKVFETAQCHGRQDLMGRAAEIMVKSFSNLIETGALANAEEDTLVYLLERDDVNIEEVKLFQLILDWGKIQVQEAGGDQSLKDKLRNVISKIRYTNMTLLEFTTLVVPTGLLSAEESLSVYSYLGGDEATRATLKMKFNTARRIVGNVEKFVEFFPEKQFKLNWVPAIQFQSLLFEVQRPEPAQAIQKTAFISRIKFQWPKTLDRCELDANRSFYSIYIKKFTSRLIYDIKFEVLLEDSESERGISDEIDVKPPVELKPWCKYTVTVRDDSPSRYEGNERNHPLFYYGHVLSTAECTASHDLLLDNGCVDFKETRMETDYFNYEFSKSPSTLVLIKGITIELV